MVIMCEINADKGIICSMIKGEDVTVYKEAQKQLKLHGWSVEFSRAGNNARVAKLVCSYDGGDKEMVGRHRLFFVLKGGTLYLKIKPKSVDANFVVGDLASTFHKKHNIHEVRKADPNRIIEMIARKPDGTPCQHRTIITDGEIVSKSGYAASSGAELDGRKVQRATWVIASYEYTNKEKETRRFNVLYSMKHDYEIMEIFDNNYDELKLSQLR